MQNPLLRKTLTDFGQYVGEMLPKYVQKVEVTNCEELDIMIHPEGIIPMMQFLKDHHNAQFLNIIDIAGMDVPTRPYRFEVVFWTSQFFRTDHKHFNKVLKPGDKNISIFKDERLTIFTRPANTFYKVPYITVKMIFTQLNS